MKTMKRKNYIIELYSNSNRNEWLKNRCIGGTDLAKIVNNVARWGTIIDLYDEIKNPVINDFDNEAMRNGRLAEEHIKSLFLLSHKELVRTSSKTKITLIRRTDYPEMTLSPDTLVKRGHDDGYIEIKLKTIYSEKEIEPYMTNLKEEEPQYYWQNVDYFIVKPDIKFGYLVVCFDLQKLNENGKWEHDKFIIDSLYFTRDVVKEDIELGETKTIDFIVNNLRKNIRPRTILKGQKGVQIEWSKLSNIKILKQ